MAGFPGYQTSVWHETEDAILWSPTDENFEYVPFDMSMMTRLAMSTEHSNNNNNIINHNFGWQNSTTAPPSAGIMTPPSRHNLMDGLAETMHGSSKDQSISNGLSFGLHNQASQWHGQEQAIDWQSINQCCNNDAYLQMQDPTLPNTPPFSYQPLVSNHNYAHTHTHHTHNHIATPRTSSHLDQVATSSNTTTTPIIEPLPDVFASTRAPYQDPPSPSPSTPVDAHPQRKSKRCSEDLYTPRWVRNAGTSREGWCGWCTSWFTLRDSAYWYHMHYSHGISQANSGKRLPAPAGFRAFGVAQPVEWEVKCGKCARWMPLLPGDKCNTAYFRHTYKCYFKTVSAASARGDKSGPSSPATSAASPSRRRMDML